MTVQVVLLCEDRAHDTFVRRFLRKRRFISRQIHTVELPAGRQAGEQWVRSRYPDQLEAVRSRGNAHLVVVTDADQYSTDQRRAQLDQECDRREVKRSTEDDPVIFVVPRRNIETWFEYLDGGTVDETTVYPKRFTAADQKRLAEELHRMCYDRQRLPESPPPSLSESCGQRAKLPSAN